MMHLLNSPNTLISKEFQRIVYARERRARDNREDDKVSYSYIVNLRFLKMYLKMSRCFRADLRINNAGEFSRHSLEDTLWDRTGYRHRHHVRSWCCGVSTIRIKFLVPIKKTHYRHRGWIKKPVKKKKTRVIKITRLCHLHDVRRGGKGHRYLRVCGVRRKKKTIKARGRWRTLKNTSQMIKYPRGLLYLPRFGPAYIIFIM